MAIMSFNESRYGSIWTGFSLKWYERLLQERNLWIALRTSLIVGVFATLFSTILGTTAALALHRYKTFIQKIHYGLIYLPLIIPDILMGISLLVFFVALFFPLGMTTIIIAHTTFCTSYVAMVVLSRLYNLDFSVVEAAYDLGATRLQMFRKVMMPLLSPAIISGALLAFTLSIDDFVITFFVAGAGTTTLPIYVYSMIKFGSTPLINALSVILLSITTIAIFITQRLSKETL
jgi:spermidine/putrescine transport system permease protein